MRSTDNVVDINGHNMYGFRSMNTRRTLRGAYYRIKCYISICKLQVHKVLTTFGKVAEA